MWRAVFGWNFVGCRFGGRRARRTSSEEVRPEKELLKGLPSAFGAIVSSAEENKFKLECKLRPGMSNYKNRRTFLLSAQWARKQIRFTNSNLEGSKFWAKSQNDPTCEEVRFGGNSQESVRSLLKTHPSSAHPLGERALQWTTSNC